MPFDPNIHHRRSIRLKGYDYSKAGRYFITICVQDRACLFGKIIAGKLILNDSGEMILKWWNKIPEKFPDIKLGEFVIMPNHFHAIVINVGIDPRVNPNDSRVNPNNEHNESNDAVCFNSIPVEKHKIPGETLNENRTGGGGIWGEHMGSPLRSVVQWFKTMTTNEYIRGVKNANWPRFNRKLWQRNYYEHIIRNEKSFQNISKYIISNPVKWRDDNFYN